MSKGKMQIFIDMELEKTKMVQEQLEASLKSGKSVEMANSFCEIVERVTDDFIQRMVKRWDGKKIV